MKAECAIKIRFWLRYSASHLRLCSLPAFATMYRAAAVVSAIRAYNMCATYIFHTLYYVICIYIPRARSRMPSVHLNYNII